MVAAAAVAEGFDAVKLAPFGSVRTPLGRQQDIENGIRCVRAVREAIGAGVDLLVDCYSLYTSAEALAIAAELRSQEIGELGFGAGLDKGGVDFAEGGARQRATVRRADCPYSRGRRFAGRRLETRFGADERTVG